MEREKTGPWAYVSAGALASLTLFVFWALQNYGPESTVRRFHTVVARIYGYLPPDQPYDPRFLKREDLIELASLTGSAQNKTSLATLINTVVALNASYTMPRIDYKTSRSALVVVLYQRPEGVGPAVFVLEKPGTAWIINTLATEDLLKRLHPRPRQAF